MSIPVACPRCNQPVDPQVRVCDHCGVDLALAAILAAWEVMPTLQPHSIDSSSLIAPEILVPRMGETMIEMGLLTPDRLQIALEFQQNKAMAGQPLLLGQAMLELGLIDRETLDRVTTKLIFNLQSALNTVNHHLEQRIQERTRDLQLALSKLSEINQLKANFIANISHELRTPLTHFKGYLDLLITGELGVLNKQQEAALEVLQKSEIRLEQIIEDLIQFSLASRGDFNLDLKPIQIQDLVKFTISRSRNKARSRSIILETFVPQEVLMIRVDQDKIGWVLLQLANNALKFTPEGGRVGLAVKHFDGFLTISVTDTGIGIPAERIEEIFEPFHQLDGSATRRYGGTGLGLAMVKKIIEAHGSHIIVSSEIGKGSCFEFTLPLIDY